MNVFTASLNSMHSGGSFSHHGGAWGLPHCEMEEGLHFEGPLAIGDLLLGGREVKCGDLAGQGIVPSLDERRHVNDVELGGNDGVVDFILTAERDREVQRQCCIPSVSPARVECWVKRRGLRKIPWCWKSGVYSFGCEHTGGSAELGRRDRACVV